jgi:hypothetical protein
MINAYESAQRAYNTLVEQTRGKVLSEKPFAFWLEEMKRQGKFWGA